MTYINKVLHNELDNTIKRNSENIGMKDNENSISERARDLIKQMEKKGSLPALSENVLDIFRLTKLSETRGADLAAVIMRDCGLTSSMLVTANSAYYSPRYPIKTVSAAVTFLGFEKVYSLAFGLSVFKQNVKAHPSNELLELYASSYFTGTLSMSLARRYKYKNPEEIFVAGLFYQLPSVGLAYTFPEQFQKMEGLIREEKLSINKACKESFGVEYDEICRGVAEIYKVPGKIKDVLIKKDKNDALSALINESGNISDMLFGAKPGGKIEIAKIGERIQNILGQGKFSLTDFIKETCYDDKNIARFFDLDHEDIEMMVNILEWGKDKPSQVISKLDIGKALEDSEKQKEDPETLFGRFMTEFAMERKKNAGINQVLMLAQEAMYRCLQADIFTVFFDSSRKALKARLYAGDNTHISSGDFQLDTAKSDSPIFECISKHKTISWNDGQKDLELPNGVSKQLNIKYALFSPIFVDGKSIGLYFASRPEGTTFSERDEIWMEQIIESVELSFEKLGRNKA